jgi:hypothetical protein
MAVTRTQVSTLSSVAASTTAGTNFATNPTAGNKIIVGIFAQSLGLVDPTSVTDDASNTYTLALSYHLGTGFGDGVWIYYADNIALPGAGTLDVTVTWPGSYASSIQAVSYSGVATGAPAATNTHSAAPGTTNNSGAAGSGTSVLHFAAMGLSTGNNPANIATTAPFTQEGAQQNGSTFFVGAVSDQINAAASQTCTWTYTSANASQAGIAAWDASAPTDVAWTRRRGRMLWPGRGPNLPRRRSRKPSVQAAAAPQVTTQDLPPQVPTRDRVFWLARAKARRAEPPPVQVIVTVQALPPQVPTRDRVFWLPRARARQAQPPPAPIVVVTTQALPPQTPTRDRVFAPRRRGFQAQPPPPPAVTVTVPPQPGRRRLVLPRRGPVRRAQPIPAQVVIQIGPQALPPQPGRRRWGFLPRIRPRQAQPVPAQVIITTGPQALPPQPGRRRIVSFPRRRPTSTAVVRVTVQAVPQPPQQSVRDRLVPQPLRRSRNARPVPPPVVVVTAQALPPQPGRRRLRFLPRPRRGQATQLFRVYVIGPNDGVPVKNPGTTLTMPVSGTTLTMPVSGTTLTVAVPGTTLTVPDTSTELTVPATRTELT